MPAIQGLRTKLKKITNNQIQNHEHRSIKLKTIYNQLVPYHDRIWLTDMYGNIYALTRFEDILSLNLPDIADCADEDEYYSTVIRDITYVENMWPENDIHHVDPVKLMSALLRVNRRYEDVKNQAENEYRKKLQDIENAKTFYTDQIYTNIMNNRDQLDDCINLEYEY